jgi:uncharacterized SAM-binding protein YcdF (DUF218 family)
MGLLLYAASTPLMTAAGRQLVHDDPLRRVDAIIALASGLDRLVEAADLFKDGYAAQLVLTSEPLTPAEEFLIDRRIEVETADRRRRRILEALGVPASAIVILPEPVNSTVEEAHVFAKWASTHPVRSLMIVTSPPHTARARLTFMHELQDRNIEVFSRAARLGAFRPDSWWRSRATLRDGVLEWQKLVYYRLVELPF